MKKLVGILFFVSATAFISPVQKINFSGSWSILEDKSDFQDQPLAVMYKMLNVKQTADSLVVTGTRFPNPDNPGVPSTTSSNNSTTVTSYPLNGNPIQTIFRDGRKMTASIRFAADHHSLVRNSSYSLAGDINKEDYKSEEIWTLSEDGKTLTLSRTFSRTDGYITIKALYEKR